MQHVERWAGRILLAIVCACALSCTSLSKQNGVFHAKGVGVKILTFNVPRTDFETVQDRIRRDVGPEALITNSRKSTFLDPLYNVLYPILGFEIGEIDGTY